MLIIYILKGVIEYGHERKTYTARVIKNETNLCQIVIYSWA